MTEDVLARVRGVAPLLDERAAEGEQLRTMPPDVVARLKEAGVFKLGLPRSLGGLECDPVTAIEALETLAHADGSGGWTAMIGNTGMFTAWLDPRVAAEIFDDDPDVVMAGLFAPVGKAVPTGDGLAVSGRWNFNSGCPHSDWYCLGTMVMDGGAPKQVPPGRPDHRFTFLPASEAEIVDTWDAPGLRGTGSHDIVIDRTVVPEERTCNPFFDPVRHDGPLYRIPFWNLLMILMAPWPLGVGRRAIEEFAAVAKRKSRGGPGPSLVEDEVIQVEVARAATALDAARTMVIDAAADAWSTVTAGDDLSVLQCNRITASTHNALAAGMAAADLSFHRAGGSSTLFGSNALQRCFRDIHAGAQHIALSTVHWKEIGRALLAD